MSLRRIAVLSTLCCSLLALLPAATTRAQSGAASTARKIAPFLDDQTIAIAYVDLQAVDVEAIFSRLAEVVPETRIDRDSVQRLERMRKALTDGGARSLFVVVSMADIPFSAPLFVAPGAGGSVRQLREQLPLSNRSVEARSVKGALVIGGQQAINRLETMRPSLRPQLENSFKEMGDSPLQLHVLTTPRDRRVIEETLPVLPAEIGGGPSTVLTRGLHWAALGIQPPPEMAFRMTVQSENKEAATALQAKWKQVAELMAAQAKAMDPSRRLDVVARLMTPEVSGAQLKLLIDSQNERMPELLAAITPPLEQTLRQARRVRSSNNLKEIAIAVHNWHDVHKAFPAQANYGASGRPLLSWRVHLLPFLDEGELYQQFHLDEPWDSEHNRKLIDKMPAVYRSLGSNPAKGHTSYVRPVGERTCCPGAEAITFRQITDGSVNTIMVVEVNDDQSVAWTKPEDLPFDHPTTALGGLYDGGFNAAFCDGSVRFLKLPIEPDDLSALYTRDGEEPINRDKFK